jgi:hypothetical protein
MKGDIYPNNLYSPTCTNISTAIGRVHVGGLWYIGYDPCSSNYSKVYFNRARRAEGFACYNHQEQLVGDVQPPCV